MNNERQGGKDLYSSGFDISNLLRWHLHQLATKRDEPEGVDARWCWLSRGPHIRLTTFGMKIPLHEESCLLSPHMDKLDPLRSIVIQAPPTADNHD